MDEKVWKRYACESRKAVGKETWKEGVNNAGRKKMCRWKKSQSFANGSIGAGIKLMVRGGCVRVKGSERMSWKCDND